MDVYSQPCCTMSGSRAERSEGGLVSGGESPVKLGPWYWHCDMSNQFQLYDCDTRCQIAAIQSNHFSACDRTHWERRSAIGTPFCLLQRAGTSGDGGAACCEEMGLAEGLLDNFGSCITSTYFNNTCQSDRSSQRVNSSLQDPREAHVRSGIFAVSQRCGATGLAVCWLLMLGRDRVSQFVIIKRSLLFQACTPQEWHGDSSNRPVLLLQVEGTPQKPASTSSDGFLMMIGYSGLLTHQKKNLLEIHDFILFVTIVYIYIHMYI